MGSGGAGLHPPEGGDPLGPARSLLPEFDSQMPAEANAFAAANIISINGQLTQRPVNPLSTSSGDVRGSSQQGGSNPLINANRAPMVADGTGVPVTPTRHPHGDTFGTPEAVPSAEPSAPQCVDMDRHSEAASTYSLLSVGVKSAEGVRIPSARCRPCHNENKMLRNGKTCPMCPRSRKALSERMVGWKTPLVSPDTTASPGQPRRHSVASETAFSTTSAPGRLNNHSNGHGRLQTGVARCDAPLDPNSGGTTTTQGGAVSATGVSTISGNVGSWHSGTGR